MPDQTGDERERLYILYEDRLGQTQPEFPLHRLVTAAAHDRCETLELWRLKKRVKGIPKKGRDNVLADLGRSRIYMNTGGCLLAWLDEDRIRDAFPDAARSTREEVISLVKGRAGDLDPGRLEVFLLDRNLESLLESLERELVDGLDRETVGRALDKRGKSAVDSRDRCLLHIANSPRLRELLQSRHEGFSRVTQYISDLTTREPWPFH